MYHGLCEKKTNIYNFPEVGNLTYERTQFSSDFKKQHKNCTNQNLIEMWISALKHTKHLYTDIQKKN